MTWHCSFLPQGPRTATEQLDAWVSNPIYQAKGVLLPGRGLLEGKRDRAHGQRGTLLGGWYVE